MSLTQTLENVDLAQVGVLDLHKKVGGNYAQNLKQTHHTISSFSLGSAPYFGQENGTYLGFQELIYSVA